MLQTVFDLNSIMRHNTVFCCRLYFIFNAHDAKKFDAICDRPEQKHETKIENDVGGKYYKNRKIT